MPGDRIARYTIDFYHHARDRRGQAWQELHGLQHHQRVTGFDAVAGELADEVVGVAYRVPDDDAERVLAELDFREKGGYSRRVVDVTRVGGDDASEGRGAPSLG